MVEKAKYADTAGKVETPASEGEENPEEEKHDADESAESPKTPEDEEENSEEETPEEEEHEADGSQEFVTHDELDSVITAIQTLNDNVSGKGHDYYQDEKDKEKYAKSRAGRAEAREEAAREAGKMAVRLTEKDREEWNRQNPERQILSKKSPAYKALDAEGKRQQEILRKEARMVKLQTKLHNTTLDEQNGIRHGLGYSVLRKVVGGRKTLTQQMKEAEKLAEAKKYRDSLRAKPGELDSEYEKRKKKADAAVARAEKRVNDSYKGFLLKGGRGMLNGARFVGAKAAVAGRFARNHGPLALVAGVSKKQKDAANNVLDDYAKTLGGEKLAAFNRIRAGQGSKQDKAWFKLAMTPKEVQQALRMVNGTNARSVGMAKAIARSGFGRGVGKAAKGTAQFFAGMFGGRLTKLGESKSKAFNAGNALSWLFAPTGILKAVTHSTFGISKGIGKGLAKGTSWIGRNTVGRFHKWNTQRKENTKRAHASFLANEKQHKENYDKRIERANAIRGESLLKKNEREQAKMIKKLEAIASGKGPYSAVNRKDLALLLEKVKIDGSHIDLSKLTKEEEKRFNKYLRTSAEAQKIKQSRTGKEMGMNPRAVASELKKKAEQAAANLAKVNREVLDNLEAGLKGNIDKAIKDATAQNGGKPLSAEGINKIIRSEINKAMSRRERMTRNAMDSQLNSLRSQLQRLQDSSNTYRKNLNSVSASQRKTASEMKKQKRKSALEQSTKQGTHFGQQ